MDREQFDAFAEDDELIEVLSRLFKAMADPTRLKILYALMLSTCNVSKLVDLLSMSQSSISHQLSELRKEGLIRARKQRGTESVLFAGRRTRGDSL
ncbi:DNA-binding transcriptional ArsR family regulator [Peptoniphilus ivorii]|uniref:ArsR/SmtB family transcription factor n=1 Tax=Aedoeadaptatus ivorii TaxID=54006 RepID=UPI00277F549C|nr:metalloregulator ArsR/SmtB family transcription factor [Peptoniphilus ivorii]MDQ0508156.1 DNA-binding transcriptional ArsR family regulator [Peptoniphilus ivorii]